MNKFEYKVVPAPHIKGRADTHGAGLAAQLESQLNAHATDGWEFVRTDVVSVQRRRLLKRAKTELTAIVVYRRELETVARMPQLVLGAKDAVRTEIPSFIKARTNEMADQPYGQADETPAAPPRIENAVRGFARSSDRPKVSKPRPPLVAARSN